MGQSLRARKQPTTTQNRLKPAMRDDILLVTILVASLEATAQQLKPFRTPVFIGLSGLNQA